MSLFDRLVDQALSNTPELSPLRVVVEKELLHHDIMRILSEAGLLEKLCFIGGTCLRACHGSRRLSEDLDFTGGADFEREDFAHLKAALVISLESKYGLAVEVSEPVREQGNVDTWKLKVQTRPQAPHLPAQRIHIDICAIPTYQKKPMALLNPYGVDMGTEGLILNTESLEEIYVDKILAFALRRNRIKNRDLWDLAWLKQRGIEPAYELIPAKLADHHVEVAMFLRLAEERVNALLGEPQVKVDFRQEMRRFLPAEIVAQTVDNERFWEYLASAVDALMKQVKSSLDKTGQAGEPDRFIM
ncbi:nucleotidyl transferase AbiEii/AbiGii toxin family protein [Pseudomonas sp. 273]|uniref:nucleotidyl transferase AbiEii/AbiGii toxin family protein n=1 Tax=Pseudomonas sp. 273 TaxID=75692 RepID=UPI0023D7B9E7|nr:nucleotidyl transferase AbiEii/AbiGii toxin family protein [Pseudomonas sp. 273]